MEGNFVGETWEVHRQFQLFELSEVTDRRGDSGLNAGASEG